MGGELVKGLIGKEDMQIQCNTDDSETYDRTSSTGGITTLTKIPDIWGYTGALRPGDIIAKGPWVDIRAYGAVGDGATDDSTAIQNAVNAAIAGSRLLYIPDDNYAIGTKISFSSYVKIIIGPYTRFTALGGCTIGIELPDGDWLGETDLPSLDGFSDTGLLLKGTDYGIFNIFRIANCGSAVKIQTVNATHFKSVDNKINVHLMVTCTNGLEIYADNSANVVQGNEFYCGLTYNVQRSVYFNASPTSINPNWDSNKFVFQAIDPDSLANSRGLISNGDNPVNRIIFRVESWFGGFPATGKYIDGIFDMLHAYLRFSDTPIYDRWNLVGTLNVIDLTMADGGGDSYISATTTINSRATFNGGVPLYRNRCKIKMTTVAIVANNGDHAFYVYHQLTDGYSDRIRILPGTIGMEGMIVDYVKDNSLTNANEIEITMKNVSGGNLAALTDIYVYLEIGI